MWGPAPENSLIFPYRNLPSLTAVLGGRKWGSRAGKGSQQQACIAHLCSLLLGLWAALPASCQYHRRHPPHAHRTFTTQVPAIGKAAARFTSQSVSTGPIFTTESPFLPAVSAVQPAVDVGAAHLRAHRFIFARSSFSRPAQLTASLARPSPAGSQPSRMVYDGHR